MKIVLSEWASKALAIYSDGVVTAFLMPYTPNDRRIRHQSHRIYIVSDSLHVRYEKYLYGDWSVKRHATLIWTCKFAIEEYDGEHEGLFKPSMKRGEYR